MRGLYSSKTEIRHKIFTEIARMAYEGNALLQQKMSELDERERTINELQDMMNAQNAKVQNLLSSVKDASEESQQETGCGIS